MELRQTEVYQRYGLDQPAVEGLSRFGDLLLDPGFNVTSVREPDAIEKYHFLDSLSLLGLEVVRCAGRIADLGSGAGLPALVLALALPGAHVTAVESLQKKCAFIREAALTIGLENVEVQCLRAEEYGRGPGRASYDVVVSRALAALSVVVEYSLPLLKVGGRMLAMKGDISNEERIHGQKALDILGGGELESVRLDPFPEAENRWVHIAKKVRPTPASYPRRPGLAARRPLGG